VLGLLNISHYLQVDALVLEILTSNLAHIVQLSVISLLGSFVSLSKISKVTIDSLVLLINVLSAAFLFILFSADFHQFTRCSIVTALQSL
jgi:hypothetical protein